MYNNNNDRQQNEFNMAVSYLNRINNMFYIANQAAMELDVFTWFHALIVIFREVSTEMKEAEVDEWNKRVDSINASVFKFVKDQEQGRMSITPELYTQLHKFELYLRKILKESGLQNKIVDDASKALR